MKIGVVLTISPDSDTAPVPAYSEVREKAQAAEASGLDSIWLYDHLLYRVDPEKTVGVWESWSVLSALAEATNRVELGTLVLCNAFRNPALLAKMAHTLDEVSGGRVLLGLGAGWHEPEFDAFGYPFDQRVGLLEEALQILNPLLKGEHVDFSGTHYQARNCVITPLGPRPEGVPLLVAAFGPRMLRLTARYADQWNAAWLGQPQELAEGLKLIESACADVGRDPATLTVTAGVNVAFPDLGPINTMTENPLSGSAEEVAQAFQAYAEAGADHLIIWHTPSTLPALERVADAARLYRSGTSG
jgi:probable F420-dependent oxidoreductase